MFWKRNRRINDNEANAENNEYVNTDEKIRKKNAEVNNKAMEYIKDHNKLQGLIREAEEKSNLKEAKKGFVQETWDSLKTMFELVKTYIKGDYRNIPYTSLVMIVGAILYFVMPVDAIPDVLAGLGYTDDAAVIVFTLKKVKEDLDKFNAWKEEQEKIAENNNYDVIHEQNEE